MNRAKSILIFIILFPAFITSVALNIYLVTGPSTLIGFVDHKKSLDRTDQVGETTIWYTVSIRLFEEDKVNKFATGETIVYIVNEEDFNQVEAGYVIKGIPQRDLSMDILYVISARATPEGLIFSSGFEKGVYLDEVILDSDVWVQYLIGEDNGYNWIKDFPVSLDGANKFMYYGVRPDANLTSCVESRIEDIIGHDGSSTKALYMTLKSFDCHMVGSSHPRNQYTTTIKNNILEEAYIQYWIKFQPNLREAMDSNWGWRIFLECMETGTQEYGWVDYIFNLAIKMDDEGQLLWQASGKEQCSPNETYTHIWTETSYYPSPESIAGKWVLMEVYWKHSVEDGRVWFAIDGETVIDYHGRNKRDSNLARCSLFKIYVSENVIINGPHYQWIDDVKIYKTHKFKDG